MASEPVSDSGAGSRNIPEDDFNDSGDGVENQGNMEVARKRIRDGEGFATEDGIERFFQDFKSIATSPIQGESNLLHAVIDGIKHYGHSPDSFKLLICRLVNESPRLLNHVNKNGQNPIFVAIKEGCDQLIQYMVSTCVEYKDNAIYKESLDDALSSKQGDTTCLHEAFLENTPPETITMLLENASCKALSVQDGYGKTPMHHAVKYEQCTPERTQLIDLLIRRDLSIRSTMSKSGKTFLDIPDFVGCSVYRQHESGRKAYIIESTITERDPTVTEPGRLRYLGPDRRDASRRQLYRLDGPDEISTARQPEPAPNTSIQRSKTGYLGTRTFSENEERETSGNGNFVENSNAILERLKLHYMRTRNTELTTSFLYGQNMDDVHIIFECNGLPQQVAWKTFTKNFGKDSSSGLKFDRVLQYVAFPHIEVQITGYQGKKQSQSQRANGRQDMGKFFDWLYQKGVRHIIKLSVEDSGIPDQKVHGDEVIQKSLERFVVEDLDWRKVDLDPVTILHISSRVSSHGDGDGAEPVPHRQLRRLSLRWSGNNAVLLAWSQPDALPLLPYLEEVEINKPDPRKAYDSPEWIRNRVTEFGDRLNECRRAKRAEAATDSGSQEAPGADIQFKDIVVTPIEPKNSYEPQVMSHDTSRVASLTSDQAINKHQWLKSTDKFAAVMSGVWKDTVDKFLAMRGNQGTTEKIEHDVVLALIDDGVNKFDMVLPEQVLQGKSFDFHEEKVWPAHSSASGHGTIMANMILRVCPMAKVYPIRLKTYNNINDMTTNIDADYAAQAIQTALDTGATIISMSWTLPITDKENNAKKRLHEVLERAVERKVLVFCSAPDKGNFTTSNYPHGIPANDFFLIGAAGADGNIFGWTEKDAITYAFPGVNVVQDHIRSNFSRGNSNEGANEHNTDPKSETGSSVATALGAGLAAMIIYCVKASILLCKMARKNQESTKPIPEDCAMQVADPKAMRYAFERLGKVTEVGFIQVWDNLDEASKVLEELQKPNIDPEHMKWFIEFGRNLVSSVKK